VEWQISEKYEIRKE